MRVPLHKFAQSSTVFLFCCWNYSFFFEFTDVINVELNLIKKIIYGKIRFLRISQLILLCLVLRIKFKNNIPKSYKHGDISLFVEYLMFRIKASLLLLDLSNWLQPSSLSSFAVSYTRKKLHSTFDVGIFNFFPLHAVSRLGQF